MTEYPSTDTDAAEQQDENSALSGWAALVVLGVGCILGAFAWYMTASSDHENERQLAQSLCDIGGDLTCDLPSYSYTWQLLLAALGAFLVLIGAILYAGRHD